MIFQRALLREFAALSGAVFLTLFAIALTTRLVRLLGQAAGGSIPSDAVVAYLGFFSLGVLPVLLSLTLFIAVLLTLTRSYRDSEMIIWFNSGLSLAAWLRPVLTFSLPVVFVIAVMSLLLTPWSAEMAELYRARLSARDDVSRITPGVFGESASKDRVFFVESVSESSDVVRNVFVSSIQHQRPGVMTSRTGRTETAPNGDRFIVLGEGRRYEGRAGEASFRVMEFERYAMRVESREGEDPVPTQKNLSTLELATDPSPANHGELVWRLGIPISALILALLAIPLSFVNPRAGRSLNLIFALIVFMLYSNLLSLSQANVVQGRLSFALGWWLIHGVMLMLLLVLFSERMRLIRFRR